MDHGRFPGKAGLKRYPRPLDQSPPAPPSDPAGGLQPPELRCSQELWNQVQGRMDTAQWLSISVAVGTVLNAITSSPAENLATGPDLNLEAMTNALAAIPVILRNRVKQDIALFMKDQTDWKGCSKEERAFWETLYKALGGN
jgi:hypothetical protein